jgi:hypothetical protein
MVPTALLPLRRKACCGFLSPSVANLGSNSKHANHYTTADDLSDIASRGNRLLLFVKHSAMRILPRICWTRQQCKDCKQNFETQEVFACDSCSSGDNKAEVNGHTDFKQCVSCNSSIRLQEFIIGFGFVVLCLKVFACCS